MVLVFLGIPLAAGTSRAPRRTGQGHGRGTRARSCRGSRPFALYGLLFTVVVLFALQGHTITGNPWAVARIALPLLAFFAIMWFGAFIPRGVSASPTRS